MSPRRMHCVAARASDVGSSRASWRRITRWLVVAAGCLVGTAPAVGQTGPVVEPRDRLQIQFGVRYASVSPAQTLDLYLPATDGTSRMPVVVLVHGGGFRSGNSRWMQNYALALADRGIASASINYRLSGEARFPAAVRDAKASVRWIRANAASFGLDPNRVGIWGRSAGGWIAHMVGVTGTRSTIFDDRSLGNAGYSSGVQAVVSWAGPTNFATMDSQRVRVPGCIGRNVVNRRGSPIWLFLGGLVRSSPLTKYTNAGAYARGAPRLPPFYLVNGTRDCVTPYRQATELGRVIRNRRDGRVKVALVRGATHAHPWIDEQQLQPTLTFLVRRLG